MFALSHDIERQIKRPCSQLDTNCLLPPFLSFSPCFLPFSSSPLSPCRFLPFIPPVSSFPCTVYFTSHPVSFLEGMGQFIWHAAGFPTSTWRCLWRVLAFYTVSLRHSPQQILSFDLVPQYIHEPESYALAVWRIHFTAFKSGRNRTWHRSSLRLILQRSPVIRANETTKTTFQIDLNTFAVLTDRG